MASGWQRYPFLRLLLPLAVGIACADAFPSLGSGGPCVAGCLFLLLLAAYRCHGCRRFFGVVLHLFLFVWGYQSMASHWAATEFVYPSERALYKVRIKEHPEEKARSLLCRSVLLERYVPLEEGTHAADSAVRYSDAPLFLLYFPKDTLAATLRRGDELYLYTRLEAPRNFVSPDEFDYVRYLRHHGVSGTAYVPRDGWQVAGHSDARTLLQAALDRRDRLVAMYHDLGFRGDELAVLSALTVGDKEELSEEIRETYSVSGAAHVLALSGMHIAFLFGVLWFPLQPLWKRTRRLRPLLAGIVLLFLWGFAFFTGLSSSVVRAVVMCSLFVLSKLQWEKPLTLNTLAATAFLMLLLRPAWLFDVGFQLSFASVAGILLIRPRLVARWCPGNRLLRYVWELLTLSVSAQIGVAPLIALYFHSFATHFLLTNLLVVPLVSMVLYAAVFMLLLAPLPALQVPVAGVVERLIRLQNELLRFIGQLPFASIGHLHVDAVDALLFYVSLFAFGHALKRRTPAAVRLFLCTALLLVAYHVAVLSTR